MILNQKKIILTLIKSISGIRGTIGGKAGENLTPADVVACTAGFGRWLQLRSGHKVVVGRDGRISGAMVSQLSIQTLLGMGLDVIDLGLSTTPTVEMMVTELGASAGIIFTASHNPGNWNALKFLNEKGEFISADDGQEIIQHIAEGAISYADVEQLGTYTTFESGISLHIGKILQYRHVNPTIIKNANLHVVVDCINSTGAIALPPLLEALGVRYELIHADNFGHFAHNPEPLPEHLADLSKRVKDTGAAMGISVDPDVDRLAFVCEDGSMFGEEYSLVAIADYILSREPGNAVSNLSSSRALADVVARYGGTYKAAAVGEVNVVREMKQINAVIGGEGNGGIIVPDLHYGRDAMAGMAIFLTLYAEKKLTMTALKKTYPSYEIIKDKLALTEGMQLEKLYTDIREAFSNEKIDTTDGIKVDFAEGWVHLRPSNTEPIVRIYAEASNVAEAQKLIQKVKNIVAI
jgi:phosphomannomutase